MLKEPYEMSDHELLMELLEDKRKRDHQDQIHRYLLIAKWIVIAILAIIILPKIYHLYVNINSTLQSIQNYQQQLSDTFGNLSELDINFSEMSEQINQIQNFFRQWGNLFSN